MIAFFGASLLYPQYFIAVRGETTLAAGLLLAPQGLGAMLTMPIAGRMTDKIGPGKFVLAGIVLIFLGVGTFTFLGADTSYWLLCGALFVQGLGMGMTMMPIMSAALATLTNAQVPDGSTMMNVVQQTASSIGTAIIGVILATGLKNDMQGGAAVLSNVDPEKYDAAVAAHMAPPQPPLEWFESAASHYGTAFIVATVLVAVTLIPAFFLPRKKIASPLTEEEMDRQPTIMH